MNQTVFLVLLAAALIAAVGVLYVQHRRTAELKAKVQAQEAENIALQNQLQAQEQKVWQAANTIDLYAALAQEQTSQQPVQNKLSAIRQAAQTLMERSM